MLYRLEEQLAARIREPAFVYEALKVYLMLGGQHPPDQALIKSWMQRDWADNLIQARPTRKAGACSKTISPRCSIWKPSSRRWSNWTAI